MIFPLLAQIEQKQQSASVVKDFVFGSPEWLWCLLLLLPLLLLRRRLGSASSLAHPGIQLIAPLLQKPSTLIGRFGPIFALLSLACLIVTLANPQWRSELSEEKVSGIDIMIACDLSDSMVARDMDFIRPDNYGRAVRHTIDRLSASKIVMNKFIEGRPNDRIGIVAFSGKARLSCPLTLDHALLSYIIDQFYLMDVMRGTPGYMKEPGTAIGSAIASAATRLEEREETKSKVIILVTDGQNNRGSIDPVDAAKRAAELGIRIFTIGIGQAQQLSARVRTDGVDEKTLREIAQITKGKYFYANSGQKFTQAFADIDRLEKSEVKRRSFVHFESLYMYPLALGCLLMSTAFLLAFIRPQPAP